MALLMGLLHIFLFITRGGYTKQIQLVKEYGLFGAYDEKFTTETSQMIFKGVCGKNSFDIISDRFNHFVDSVF